MRLEWNILYTTLSFTLDNVVHPSHCNLTKWVGIKNYYVLAYLPLSSVVVREAKANYGKLGSCTSDKFGGEKAVGDSD